MSYNLVVCKSIPVPCPSKTKGIRKTDRSLGIDINLLVLRETVRVRRRGKIIVEEIWSAKHSNSDKRVDICELTNKCAILIICIWN